MPRASDSPTYRASDSPSVPQWASDPSGPDAWASAPAEAVEDRWSASTDRATDSHPDDAPFRTWCAYDALGIPAALGRDAELTTTCGHCEREVRLRFRDGRPDRAGPELLWLAEGGADLRGSFCSPTVLLCGPEHGQAWGEAQGGHGELLDLETASRRGGSD